MSNACDTKQRAVRGSGLFKVPGVASGSRWKMERDVVHRMNEGHRAWGALESVLSNRGLGIKAKKCLYEGVIVPMALYGAEA